MLLVLLAGAAIGFVSWLVIGTPFAKRPVTKAHIEHAVAQQVFCNEEFVPQTSGRKPPQTWTCDTYLGRSAAEAQNGPSYRVIVSDDRIESIRRAPPH